MQKAFVAYYRVSTKAQGINGLGVEAQRVAVESYVNAVSGSLVATYKEVESGKRVDRIELQKAIDECRKKKAMLIIARLDRLARNVGFITKLLDSDVEFIAADMPSANRLTIHIVAAIAEYERDQISARVKGALRAAVARGAKIGNPNVRETQVLGVKAAQRAADAFALKMSHVIAGYEINGKLPLKRLAAILEREGYETARGSGRWSATTVRNLKMRIERLKLGSGPIDAMKA